MNSQKDVEQELLKYVSNIDKDVYSVKNLPEEVIAVIFAYVSRSPKSFRENLLEVTQEKASEFHEKWVLNFGHSSVAELSVAHICAENVSRLFSSILERANLFISPIEFSQRYQKPKSGNFYVPEELDQYPQIKKEYIDYNNFAYDVYEELNNALFDYHINTDTSAKESNESEKAFKLRCEKIAFEDARYVLPLSVYTNLGFTANGRAIENLVMKLLSSKYPEVNKRGEDIKREAKQTLPTLVKYSNKNPYETAFHDIYSSSDYMNLSEKEKFDDDNNDVNMLRCDYSDNEKQAIIKIIAPIISSRNGVDQRVIEKRLNTESHTKLIHMFDQALSEFGKHDELWEVFRQIRYEFQLYISEACWHQILRHRKCEFFPSEPTISNGLRIPPHIKTAKLEARVKEVASLSEAMFYKLSSMSEIKHNSAYVVTNAHKRRVTISLDLWEMYNLVNLRLTEHAQWDIREIVMEMAEKIKEKHPNLITPALNRS